jgi:hypothetical protein
MFFVFEIVIFWLESNVTKLVLKIYIIDIGSLLNEYERAYCKNLKRAVRFVMAQFIVKI